ncbi:MAG: phosphatase PAP2 family protein, partial [Minisyncoccia bacterium]
PNDCNQQLTFFMLQGLEGRFGFLDSLIVFFAEYYIYIACFVFVYFCYLEYRKTRWSKWKEYLSILITIVLAIGAFKLIKSALHVLRPYVALSVPHLLTDSSFAFPSGHTTFMFALATATYFLNKKLAYFLYISGAVIGLARIAAGVHYPSDILGGAILGTLIGVIFYKIWN